MLLTQRLRDFLSSSVFNHASSSRIADYIYNQVNSILWDYLLVNELYLTCGEKAVVFNMFNESLEISDIERSVKVGDEIQVFQNGDIYIYMPYLIFTNSHDVKKRIKSMISQRLCERIMSTVEVKI